MLTILDDQKRLQIAAVKMNSARNTPLRKKSLGGRKIVYSVLPSSVFRAGVSFLGRTGKINPECAHGKLTALEMKLCSCC